MKEYIDLVILSIKYAIPFIFSMLFRIYGLGCKSKKRSFLAVAGLFASMIFIHISMIQLLGYSFYTKIIVIVIVMGNMIVYYISNDGFWKTSFLHAINGNMMFLVSIISNCIRYVFKLSYFQVCIVLIIICGLIYFIAIKFWAKPLRFMVEHITVKWPVMVMLPVGTLFACIIMVAYLNVYMRAIPIRTTLVVLLLDIIFFIYLYLLYRNICTIDKFNKQTQRQDILNLSVESMKQRLELLEKKDNNTKVLLHDQRHFNALLLELLLKGNYKEMESILEKRVKAVPMATKVWCENLIVNGVMSYYVNMAEAENIPCDVSVNIPENINVNSEEFAMVMSNLLENAINACKKLPYKKRFIKVTATCLGQILLSVENSCAHNLQLSLEGIPIAKEKGHGIGTKSILAFIENCGGDIIYKAEDGIFSVRIMT